MKYEGIVNYYGTSVYPNINFDITKYSKIFII